MTSTKTRKTKLIVREAEFAGLLKQAKELEASIADSALVLKSVTDKLMEAMTRENLTSVEIDGVGVAEIATRGGSVTWDQPELIKILKNGAKERKVDAGDFMAKICALKARPSVAEEENLEIESAKKIGKFTDYLKIK
jgi:hypothetical protein